ncbi:hypothetical protein A2943_02825 [Candidatus Adlerbacteria bacterium RIFCSPLOWO2_01_FULL_51_16]|uniref:ABC transporter substrate-binding protein n=1 Tax=Candidatus Adlerbacteria bacterium RIFCSPLOWO2_01_FULL_51_16 TaxID=1797243 RepID=A0A1F4XGP2_9BACT|nr:MAG: hypothetical protein A2943_02825 [Candidatus Adlerbacteria bacterium RIFCSPLOWO2_01_FULL_51_16]
MSIFQTVVLGIFVVFIVAGVAVFAIFSGFGGAGDVGAVAIWGTQGLDTVQRVIEDLRQEEDAFQEVTYVQKNAATYQAELINAIAAGQGPDLFFIEHKDLYAFSDKILTIPYNAISQAQFINSYIDEGALFLTGQGSLGLPVLIDPLVMYWNRDLLAGANVGSAPQFWNDFLDLAPKITSIDTSSGVRKSAVALGEWRNIRNAKAILSTLMMQAGDPIVARAEGGRLQSVLAATPENAAESPGQSALRFYTEFANPSKKNYSWNRSLREAQDMFVAGDLAVYFGFASEYATLAARNPNLRFGVSVMPQIEGNSTRLTYGTLTGLSIARGAKNPQGALAIAQRLTGARGAGLLAASMSLPSVRRDAQVDTSGSAVGAVFVESVLIARGWIDPNPATTNTIFQTMIESVSSGRSSPAEAVSDADQELQQLLPF